MALQLTATGETFYGHGLLERPPLPDGAAAYVDFQTGLHITQADASMATNSALVFGPVSSVKSGYYYGQHDIQFMDGTRWERIEYGSDGHPLGMLMEGEYEQRLVPAHRRNLSAGTAVGAVVAADGVADEAYQQWYSLTPSGAGEASLTLSSSAVSTAGAFIYTLFDVRGIGVVQVGCGADGYINCDLSSGQYEAFDGASGTMIPRAAGGWTLRCISINPPGGLTDTAPYIASVNGLQAGRLSGAGQPFMARAPRLFASTSSSNSFTGLWPHETSDSHAPESLLPNIFGLSPTGDFTCTFRVLSGSSARTAASLLRLSSNGNDGMALRFSDSNKVVYASKNGNTVEWSGETMWAPDTIYCVGFSRTGNQIAISINGESVTFTSASSANLPMRLLTGFHGNNSWDGHIQKAIFWPDGCGLRELAQRVDHWL